MNPSDVNNKVAFMEAFRAAVDGIDRDEVCSVMKISRVIYDRWYDGSSAPCDAALSATMAALKNLSKGACE